jgi:hypothetical protein
MRLGGVVAQLCALDLKTRLIRVLPLIFYKGQQHRISQYTTQRPWGVKPRRHINDPDARAQWMSEDIMA